MQISSDIARVVYTNRLHPFVRRAFSDLNPGEEFIDGFYLRVLCHALERVAAGELKRLIITLPPRHLKSLVTSVCFPAWLLGRDPGCKIVSASYSASLAEDFGRQTRYIMGRPFYRATFPGSKLDPGKSAVDEFHTTRKGRRIATSVGGTLTGKGGNILIIDDPMKAEDAPSETMRDKVHDWFTGTMSSRLNNPRTGAIVLLAQRLHVDDLVGRLAQTGDWELLNLPARAIHREAHQMGDGATWHRVIGDLLHPERLGEAQLDAIRRELGSAAYEAQYQQSPVLPGGNLVKTIWFRTYKGVRRSSDYEAVLQSWDTASVPGINNDYSVCTTWGLINEQVDLLHVHRAQHDYPDLLREARSLRKKWRPSLIVVERAVVGIALGDELLRDGLRDVQGLAPKENKVERMSVQCAKLEQGQVGVPEHAPWLEAYLQEMGAFPNSKYDDQVDSTSQALLTLDKRPLQLRHISRYKQ